MTGKKEIFFNAMLMVLLLPCFAFSQSATIIGNNGKVQFTSEAPLELIKANSDKLKGIIDKLKNTFAFAVDMNTFNGFNSALQKEHFHENYMETAKFPKASFTGKFIEQVDLSVNGMYDVRAKGFFTVHGVQKERIIKGTMAINNGTITIHAAFTVRLEDHDIKVPKIVYEKIAEEIQVDINIQFKQ